MSVWARILRLGTLYTSGETQKRESYKSDVGVPVSPLEISMPRCVEEDLGSQLKTSDHLSRSPALESNQTAQARGGSLKKDIISHPESPGVRSSSHCLLVLATWLRLMKCVSALL